MDCKCRVYNRAAYNINSGYRIKLPVTGYIPNLEVRSIADWKIWLKSIETIKKLDPEIIVPGHGYVIKGPDKVEKELDNIKNILYRAIEDKKAPTL